jgi:hypothetical protein
VSASVIARVETIVPAEKKDSRQKRKGVGTPFRKGIVCMVPTRTGGKNKKATCAVRIAPVEEV